MAADPSDIWIYDERVSFFFMAACHISPEI